MTSFRTFEDAVAHAAEYARDVATDKHTSGEEEIEALSVEHWKDCCADWLLDNEVEIGELLHDALKTPNASMAVAAAIGYAVIGSARNNGLQSEQLRDLS